MTDLTAEIARKLLRYEPNTGKLFWRKRGPEWFETDNIFKTWNTRFAGKEALACKDHTGYWRGRIFGKMYQSHRVIWLIVHGHWPQQQIDHINGIRDDNRLENLREVTNQQNSKNQKLRSTNASGFAGVHWDKRRNKWMGYIMVDGKLKFLGYFDSRRRAAKVRKKAEIEHNFHPNNGRV